MTITLNLPDVININNRGSQRHNIEGIQTINLEILTYLQHLVVSGLRGMAPTSFGPIFFVVWDSGRSITSLQILILHILRINTVHGSIWVRFPKFVLFFIFLIFHPFIAYLWRAPGPISKK